MLMSLLRFYIKVLLGGDRLQYILHWPVYALLLSFLNIFLPDIFQMDNLFQEFEYDEENLMSPWFPLWSIESFRFSSEYLPCSCPARSFFTETFCISIRPRGLFSGFNQLNPLNLCKIDL
jgi:hypothetical protein